jgi:hypothetical protein
MHLALPVHFAIGVLAVAVARFYSRKILRACSPEHPVYEDCGTCGGVGVRGCGTRSRQGGRSGCPACNYEGFVLRYEHH